jgi:membrane protein DedA with SNARE-associated domain
MWLVGEAVADPATLEHHYGNLVFMGVFFVVLIVGVVWWVWRNN